ncbi:MAG: MgtC/SapB family protein [Abditibacteriaceae bacterium]
MLTTDQIILRLILAAIFGSIVGLERERLDWAAGLRTHMLVCLGAALFMIVSAYGFMDVLSSPNSHIVLDPSRVAAQVVSGIGFLGAGTIIFRKEVIRGLTTAASLWAVAAVGLAVGGGLYAAAIATTFLMLLILAGIKPLEKVLFKNHRTRFIKIIIGEESTLMEVRTAINAAHINLKQIVIRDTDSEMEHEVELMLDRINPKKLLPLAEALRNLKGVREVNYNAD